MGYPQTLEVLARLHIDASFRAAYLKDPSEAMRSLPLTETEREQLARISPTAVERAGRMMDYHRVARVTEQLLWVNAALRPDMRALLHRFMAQELPEVLNREEAISFCRFLEAAPDGVPAYVPELARCERLRIALAWGLEPGVNALHSELFQYPVLVVLKALEQPGWPRVERAPTRVVYTKVPSMPAVLLRAESTAAG